MESARLSSQMDAYLQWRQEIHRELTRYRGWLIDHNVQNAELEAKQQAEWAAARIHLTESKAAKETEDA